MKALTNIKQTLTLTAILSVLLFAGCDSPVDNSKNLDKANDLTSETPTYGEMDKRSEKAVVKNSYIVILKENSNASENAQAAERSTGGKVGFVYSNALKGFSLQLPPQASEKVLEALRKNPNVESIEEDKQVFAVGTQTNATWGLDRIDQVNLPLDDIYNYETTGENITAYILDTGINYSHTDFSGRASFGFDAFGGDGADCDGHGTHVAGTVGGDTWGVAKNVDLVAVRVLDCNGSGTLSGVIAGIDWVTDTASGASVANMSLGGGFSSSLNTAVSNSVAAGITYAVAAGNSDADACNFSPASTAEAITVGSTTSSDARSSFSNYGSCVDIFAPGSGITSAWVGSNSATRTISGTSMASPHVAGAAALYLQNNASATPAEVYTALFNNSTKDIVTNSNTEDNHLLYTIFGSDDGGSDPEPDPNADPTADFSFTVSELDVQFTDGSSDSDGSIASWSWNFGDGNTSDSQNPAHTYAQDGSYDVSLTVADDDGATNSITKTVDVAASSDDGGGDEPTNGAPSITTFTIDSYSSGPWNRADVTWSVSDSDGNLSTVKTEFLNGTSVIDSRTTTVSGSSASGFDDYRTRGSADGVRLTVTDNSGNSVYKTKNLDGSDRDEGGSDPEPEPNNPPSADFTFTASDLTVQFTDASTDSDGSVVSYSWAFGDGNSSTSENPSHTYSSEGTYSVTLTVTDDAGDSDSVTKSVQVTAPVEEPNNPPTADFTFSATDLSVDFASTSSDIDGNIASYSWNFGDGSSSVSANPSHTYGSEGTYSVSLTVTDNDGDSDTVTKSVQVTAPVAEPANPPVINSVSVSTRKTGPWNRAEVNWSVSDADGDLTSVKTEILDGSSVVDSITTSVSGSNGSGLTELRNRGSISAVKVTVTDSEGNTTTQTENI